MSKSSQIGRFHCEYEGCGYRDGSGKYFLKLQYLKQHYDKVHAPKKYECTQCGKGFATTTLLKSHLNNCGRDFTCSCGVVYKSNEALLTHAKRKNHPVKTTERRKRQTVSKPLITGIPIGTPIIILQPSYQVPVVSQHVMAAVALSELAAQNNKKEVSTQTEQNLEMWLNFPDSDGKERINTLGTQTDDTRTSDSPNPDSPPNARCSSPWLCSSAETQTADDDILLKPLNLCNDIQTQTPWSVEVEDEDESTQLAHTETQTLLSSFFLDVDCTERQRLVKQNSEDGSTEMFRLVESDR